jgi:hypothetical protein
VVSGSFTSVLQSPDNPLFGTDADTDCDANPPQLSVQDAEQSYIDAGHEVERIANEISRLEELHSDAITRHSELGAELCRVLERRLRETLAETECEVKIKGSVESSRPRKQGEPSPVEPPELPMSEKPTGDYSNMSASICELWATRPIDRFGKKKQESLVAACPTVGDFERLREEAGRSFKSLHEILPGGIGRSVADELEERQLDWLKANASKLVDVEQVDDEIDADGDSDDEFKQTEETEIEDSEDDTSENPYDFS